MQMTDEALKEFETLWRKDNPNKKISRQQLIDMATRILHLVELIYGTKPRKEGDRSEST